MLNMSVLHSVTLTALVCVTLCGYAQADLFITIPLSKTVTNATKEIHGEFINLNASATLQVNFSNLTDDSFIIFQVHSHLYNVTLYENTVSKKSSVQGRNVGMYSTSSTPSTFFVFNQNKKIDVRLYISVHKYEIKDPIPGGCNMEFPLPISPFMETTFNGDYIFADAAPPKLANDSGCHGNFDLRVYRLYLAEGDLTEEAYFDGLMKMMSLEGVLKNGELLPETGIMWPTRRMVAAYPGTGSIFVAMVVSGDRYALYVPSQTYACQPLEEHDGCYLLDDVLSQFVCAALLFIGVFVCYFGHQFFKIEMFLVGLVSGTVVTYIVVCNATEWESHSLMGAALVSGFLCGVVWYFLWFAYGIPVVSVLLTTLNLGFLVGAIMYYRLPGGIYSLEQDFNFWTLFIFVVLSTSALLISTTLISNIVCCCILGAYAAIYPIDYYVGSSLKYIMINVIRRATVPKFNSAIVSPPFELSDAMLTLFWVSLSLTGFLAQYYNSRGRPPFPPPPHVVSNRMPSPDPGPRVYGTLPIPRSRNNSRPSSRDGSRPGSRTGSRSRLHIPQSLYQSIQTAFESQPKSGERSPLLS